MIQPLTSKQRAIFEYVNAYIHKAGYAPTLEEIGRHFGLRSLATVSKHLEHLRERGYITRAWNRSRAIEIVVNADCCPTCGQALPKEATA